MLGHEDTLRILTDAGIPMAPGRFVPAASGTGSDTAVVAEAAGPFLAGGGVALKLLAPGFSHKSDAGLLRLGLGDRAAVMAAASEMRASLPSGCVPEGFLVQPMIPGGLEVFLGAQVDPQFGPVVAFGPGGILVEIMGGVDFLRPPFNRHEAATFVERNPLYPILRGERGGKPRDLDAITDAIMALGNLMADRARGILSVDINPFAVFARGEGALALDARIEEVPR